MLTTAEPCYKRQRVDYVKKSQFYDLICLLQEESDDEDDKVDIEEITPYEAPGSLLRKRTTQPTPTGHSHNTTRSKIVNPYDNVADSAEEQEERRYLNVDEMREHERMSSCKFSQLGHLLYTEKQNFSPRPSFIPGLTINRVYEFSQ